VHYEVECEAHGGTGSEVIRAVLADLRTRFTALHPVVYSKLDLTEHLERLAADGRLPPMLDGETLTAEAYEQIEQALMAS